MQNFGAEISRKPSRKEVKSNQERKQYKRKRNNRRVGDKEKSRNQTQFSGEEGEYLVSRFPESARPL
jgi:hypothetical protein